MSSVLSKVSSFLENKYFNIGISPKIGTFVTFLNFVSAISPPITKVSPSFIITFVSAVRVLIIGTSGTSPGAPVNSTISSTLGFTVKVT